MTEYEYLNFIRATLRRAFRFWIPLRVALKAAERPSQSANKRLKYEYHCNDCGGWFPRKEVEVDHVLPCGTFTRLEDVVQFIRNLTPENPGLFQVLCKRCHRAKTNYEAMVRRDAQQTPFHI
jgi:hypothetical protein